MSPDRPFLYGPYRLAMGLRSLDPAAWLLRGEDAQTQLSLRRCLLVERPDEVLAALPGSEAAQEETLALVLEHLAAHHSDAFAIMPGEVVERATGTRFGSTSDTPPLVLVGRLVQEDFCLLAPDAAGYRLVAGVLCFPLHWRLHDKLGRPMDVIHSPVPGFADELARPVARFFQSLQPARPVWRVNWSLVDTPDLFLPPEHRGSAHVTTPEAVGDLLWLRCERQTLRRLPVTGAVLFTIRTHVERLGDVVREPGVAAALAARVREMPAPMARYKGIAPIKDALLAYLEGAS